MNSPVLAEAYFNLAASLHGQRRRDEALESYRRGIEIMTNAGQKDAPNMAVVLRTIFNVIARDANAGRIPKELPPKLWEFALGRK